ncbi:anti-sigma factor family protein [Variovorax terrae]|uniref:Anti-sigma factor n=1 Tax=Variovorax terrae TaxID=2923278 RepID=A0A9X1VRE3_9BURK|nr:anti-sigma factor [Variovorax terrae]MCJ0762416.1 anti-sigma factor [Variovorax terrae]
MPCHDIQALLNAYIDDELDPQGTAAVADHLAGCDGCRRVFAQAQALRDAVRAQGLRHALPPALQRRVRAAVRDEGRRRSAWARAPWAWINLGAALASLMALAVTLTLYLGAPSPAQRLGDEVVASHVRSLMVSHLTDVPSTDQHTVKPWFNGKLDFSPPVADLAAQDFTLVGGRLDYLALAQRPVAVLVYRRREHVVNLYVWPDASGRETPPDAASQQGFQQVRWAHGGMRYWAVSDLNATELAQFQRLFAAATHPG